MKRVRKQVKRNTVKTNISKWVTYFKLVTTLLSLLNIKIPAHILVSPINSRVETIFRKKEYEETNVKITIRSGNFDVKYQRKKVVKF